jgi:hypothetical protein
MDESDHPLKSPEIAYFSMLFRQEKQLSRPCPRMKAILSGSRLEWNNLAIKRSRNISPPCTPPTTSSSGLNA